jgi:hypothetical protein
MITVQKYKAEHKHTWDNFVKTAKNGHFMFYRNYMEYHSDRFEDHSLLFTDDKDRLTAILPANLNGEILYSHQGLTFGGLILTDKASTNAVLEIFSALKEYLASSNIRKLIYKPIPHIYASLPSDEDLYALFVSGAHVFRRDVSSLVDFNGVIKYTKGRKWTVNKAKKENIEICRTDDFSQFWTLLNGVLQAQHGAKPVHSITEIDYLRSCYPDNIKLFTANHDGKIIAGAVTYETELVAHTQYLSNSDLGRELGALDFLIDHLIKNEYKNKKYFDFGISTENGGLILNKGLISQKEGFGARAMVQDVYELEIK